MHNLHDLLAVTHYEDWLDDKLTAVWTDSKSYCYFRIVIIIFTADDQTK